MLIGILQCGHFPEELQEGVGDYGEIYQRLLSNRGYDFAVYPVVDGIFPDGPTACDAWLISGSKFGAYEDLPWIPPLEDLIRAIHTSKRPLVGICFGHQIIAQALGGKVDKFTGGWGIGRQTYHFDQGDLALNAWHQDQIVALPPEARVVGSSASCQFAALAYGDHVLTMQPHPEFGAPEMGGLLRLKGQDVLDPIALSKAQADLAVPVDNPLAAEKIAKFFEKVLA